VELKSDLSKEDSDNWKRLGVKIPDKRYFKYTVEVKKGTDPTEEELAADPFAEGNPPMFTAKAELIGYMRSAAVGETITINNKGEKKASKGLLLLIPSFGAVAQ
jgi:PDZ domain-containing secreted protein